MKNKSVCLLSIAFFMAISLEINALPTLQKEAAPIYKTLSEQFQKGELNLSQFLQFRFQALFEPDKLPSEYQSLANDGRYVHPCATIIIKNTFEQMKALSLAEQETLRAAVARPPSAGFFQSTRFPIRAHYGDDSQKAGAQAILGWIESVWDVEVAQMGFRPAVPDNGKGGSDDFDVYIRSGDYGGYVAPEEWYTATPYRDMSCHMVINLGIPDDLLPSVVAHELHHVSQFAYDAVEDEAFFEQCATFLQDEVYPDIPYHYGFLDYFQTGPHRAINFFDYGAPVQYGAWVWPEFLSEFYGGGTTEIIRRAWENCTQESYRNEPDYFDALNKILPEYGGTNVDDAYAKFCEWRYFLGHNDDGRHFSESEKWQPYGNLNVQGVFDAAEYPVVDVTSAFLPQEYGANYFEFLCGDERKEMLIMFEGEPGMVFKAGVIKIKKGSGRGNIELLEVNGRNQACCFVENWSLYRKVVLVVMNFGDGQWDLDDRPSQAHFTVSGEMGDQGTLNRDPFNEAPKIRFAGWATTDLNVGSPGRILFTAYVHDYDGLDDISSVQFFVQGVPIHLELNDDGTNGDAVAGDSVFSLGLDAPAMSEGNLLFELGAYDMLWQGSDRWPFLTVK